LNLSILHIEAFFVRCGLAVLDVAPLNP